MTPEESARQFIAHEGEFHLGFLPTEQANPVTAQLSGAAQNSAQDGCALLLDVDARMRPALQTAFSSPSYPALQRLMEDTFRAGGRVVFSGCGATGRLALLLEGAWREWASGSAAEAVRGIMTGGDYAFIRSVESFEDYEAFGARQIEALRVGPRDCVVGISEGGETSSVLGSVRAARAAGARAAFVCNNPHALLRECIARSRRVLEDPSIVCLEIDTGPMALSGSTRMQATTSELLVVGTALEAASAVFVPCADREQQPGPVAAFGGLVDALHRADNLAALGRWVELEAECYGAAGAVTYYAERALIDILTDTTERTPTFALPPFQPHGTTGAARPWAMVNGLAGDTAATWRAMLGREPVCLEWAAGDYAAMGAEARIVANPPRIDRQALSAFHIGNEPDASRYQHAADTAVFIFTAADSADAGRFAPAVGRVRVAYPRSVCVVVGQGSGADGVDCIRIDCPLPVSRLRLWEHLALKLVCNTVSTATMARLGRVTGNWMTHVQPTNKKLIDRATRILCGCLGIGYEDACTRLFRELARTDAPLAERPSPVHAIIGRSAHGASGGA